MSLFIASLNSGSNGNCYYIGNADEAVLIDGGISCRETEKRMKRLGLSLKNVKAIFVTHEHGDHIHGIPALYKKHQIPIYITTATLENGGLRLTETIPFNPHEPICIGNLTVTAFPKFHDARDPHSFMVANETVKVGVLTDIGKVCPHVIGYFAQCHAAFLEANYDEVMLETGGYPVALKNRIRNGKGHLSNTQAATLFSQHRPAFMSHLILSHLSRNNNKPEIVEALFNKIAGNTQIIIASRNKESKLYQITSTGINHIKVKVFRKQNHMQLSLFG